MKSAGTLLLLVLPAAALAQPAPAKHWAFQPIRQVAPPPDRTGWADGPIDRFIAAQWRERGLSPVAPSEPRALLRRISFDLIGLPPTPAEISDFDSRVAHWQRKDGGEAGVPQAALAEVVDRLLASPHYGERWGRHWMDVARYADTAGDNADYPIPEARLYRDYIIDSFNADKPYDRFVQEQIAGDILARDGPRDRYAERVVATGFLALSRRYLTAPYEMWHLTLENTIETMGMAFLGLNLRCARCHHHKFDPIAMEDYYGIYGFFAATQFPFAGSEEFASMQKHREHFAPLLPPDEAAPRWKSYHARLRQLQDEINFIQQFDKLSKELPAIGVLGKFFERTRSERKQLAASELNHLKRLGSPPDLPMAYAVSDGKPTDVRMHRGGDPDQPGPPVPRRLPTFVSGEPPPLPAASSGRLELARWLTRPDHPLTARVIVNRLWQHHFGKGLVATPNNFGVQGETPSHPELLDWLAADFIRAGWSIKAIHRRIILSKTYQLAGAHHAGNAALDPENRFCWRHDRRRLEAEPIRDALLAVAGNLHRGRPGPHPFPPITAWSWTQHNPFQADYHHHHRSVYLMTQRIVRHPFLALFDGPDTNTSTEARTSATVPLQALYWMNHPFVTEQADGFARRLMSAQTVDERIELAHRLAYGRPAAPIELDRGRRFIERYRLESAMQNARDPERSAWTGYCRTILSANEFVFVD